MSVVRQNSHSSPTTYSYNKLDSRPHDGGICCTQPYFWARRHSCSPAVDYYWCVIIIHSKKYPHSTPEALCFPGFITCTFSYINNVVNIPANVCCLHSHALDTV